MPFNNNTLDDLFREKDKELPADTHRLEAHWEQMQQLLAPKAPVKNPLRKLAPKAALVLVAVTGVVLFFVFRGKNNTPEPRNTATINNTIAKQETKTIPVPAAQKIPGVLPAIVPAKPQQLVMPAPVAAKKKLNQQASPIIKAGARSKEYIELPQEPQVFHIAADRDTAILCKDGTTIKIPAQSLADASGNTVLGEVTMIVQEYYRYEDVIAAGLTRNAEMKKKSITAGMVKFDAYLNEQKLDVKPGCSIEIGMRKDLINVKAGKSTPQSNNAGGDNDKKLQDLNIHNLGWISYERFYNDTRPVTDIRIQIPKNVDVNHLISQLAFISVQGVMPGYIEKDQVVFYNIPVGEKAWFISLGFTGKKYLTCVEQLEIKGNDIVSPVFRETSPEQFKKQLEMLTSLPVKE
jgi:hypothetical protein